MKRFWSNNNSNHTSGVLPLSRIECLNAELKGFYHYEVFREIGKDMHGQSAAPSYTQQREKEGWGERRDRGAKGEAREGEQRPLVLNQQVRTTELPLVCLNCMFCAGECTTVWLKRKNKNLSPCFSSVVAHLQAEVFTESKMRGQRRFNTLV